MQRLAHLVPAGTVAVDVGANQGSHLTKQLRTLVGPTGRVIAIEPNPTLVPSILQCEPTAEVLSVAVTDQTGPVWLYLGQQSPHASLWAANVLNPTGERLLVRGVTLDELQATGELPAPISVLKVDIQGGEAAMLRGAVGLLQTQRPCWYIELWASGLRTAGDSLEAVRTLYEASDYQPLDLSWDTCCARANGCSGHGAVDVCIVPRERSG